MTIAELKEKNITELSRIARSLEIPGTSGLRKQDLIFKYRPGRTTTICPARTIFMYRRRRFASST
jgi:hypothetical protein